ncbi:anthranilate phosphoribosyltransferase, partial [Chloroflexota bacterium]
LAGEKSSRRDVVVMNAAAALVAGNRVETLRQGAVLAKKVIDGGHALTKLEQLVEFSQSFIQRA